MTDRNNNPLALRDKVRIADHGKLDGLPGYVMELNPEAGTVLVADALNACAWAEWVEAKGVIGCSNE